MGQVIIAELERDLSAQILVCNVLRANVERAEMSLNRIKFEFEDIERRLSGAANVYKSLRFSLEEAEKEIEQKKAELERLRRLDT